MAAKGQIVSSILNSSARRELRTPVFEPIAHFTSLHVRTVVHVSAGQCCTAGVPRVAVQVGTQGGCTGGYHGGRTMAMMDRAMMDRAMLYRTMQ